MFINALWRNCWVGYWQGIQQWNSDYWKWFYLPTILLLRLGIYKGIFKQAERVTSNINLLGNIFCLFFTFFANEMIYLKQEQSIFVLVLQYNCWAIQILTVKSWSLWHLSQPLIVYHLSNFKSWEEPPQTKAREKPLGQLSHTWPERERKKMTWLHFTECQWALVNQLSKETVSSHAWSLQTILGLREMFDSEFYFRK